MEEVYSYIVEGEDLPENLCLHLREPLQKGQIVAFDHDPEFGDVDSEVFRVMNVRLNVCYEGNPSEIRSNLVAYTAILEKRVL